MPTTIADSRRRSSYLIRLQKDSNLPILMGFCIIGLLISLCLALLFPVSDDVAAIVAQLS